MNYELEYLDLTEKYMKNNIKRHLISLAITFVATFLLVVCFQISSDEFVFSKTSLVALALSGLIAGTRAVAKIIYELAYNLLSSKN
jgi:hypothetical protein